MLVISDSNTFLLEKTAKSKNINIDKIINFGPECYKDITVNSKESLILISDSFYRVLENINIKSEDSENDCNTTFLIIENLINKLTNLGMHVYFPFIPKHFIFCDRFGNYFFDNESKDIFIQSINQKLFSLFASRVNVTFLRGIEELSPEISKTYFRLSSIYDEVNSYKIINQYLEHFEKNNYKSKKLIILDLDNTIWKGTLAEDTLNGISIDKSDPIGVVYRSVQKIFLQLKEQGFLLSICSKNDEELALKALFNSRNCIFKENDIVSHKINWKTKSENIQKICEELNLSFYETIFVDDNDYECDEVSRNCLGISIFKVPKNIYKYPYMITSNKLFYLGTTTEEDKIRTNLYKKDIKRKVIYSKFEKQGTSKKEWVDSLNLKLHIELITSKNIQIPRIIQLFNRTNQFNLSNSKYNKSTFNNILKDRVYYSGQTSDRIGSEGLISVIGFKFEGYIKVYDFILSCRVFGRYIEESMLIPLFKYAITKKCDIYFDFKQNSRNLVINKFLKEITNEKFFLPFTKIEYLNEKFEKLPIKIINKELFDK